MMLGAWRYTDVFGSSVLRWKERFLEHLTEFRKDQQANGRLSANDENAGVTLLIEVQHSFKVNCPEFTLDQRP